MKRNKNAAGKNEELCHDAGNLLKSYSELFDFAPIGYLLLDHNGNIKAVNMIGAALLGAERPSLIGRNFQLMISDNDRALFSFCKNQTKESCNVRILKDDGQSAFVRIEATATGCGQDCRVVLIDITERKEIEQALTSKTRLLEKLNNTLEKHIAHAVSDLREKDQLLIQQGRLAAMGEMINSIAHQWRQPLNNIGLIVQNLQFSFEMGELTAADVNKQIANAMEIIMHMSRTIDDFRKFFNKDKEKQDFFVHTILDRVLGFIGPSLRNSATRVEVMSDKGVTTNGYENEYSQVLLNILANARDVFVERGIKEPCISVEVTSKDDHSLVVIRDNGGGIADDVLPKIFDPYFSTKKQGSGSGIGLYMSKTIIEKNMGGKLMAQNIPEGVEFRIEV